MPEIWSLYSVLFPKHELKSYSLLAELLLEHSQFGDDKIRILEPVSEVEKLLGLASAGAALNGEYLTEVLFTSAMNEEEVQEMLLRSIGINPKYLMQLDYEAYFKQTMASLLAVQPGEAAS